MASLHVFSIPSSSGGATAFFTSLVVTLIIGAFFLFYTNLTRLGGVVMRDHVVVEQPIRLRHNFTARLVNESVSFLETHARSEQPFLLFVSWVQVSGAATLRRTTRAGAGEGWNMAARPLCLRTGNLCETSQACPAPLIEIWVQVSQASDPLGCCAPTVCKDGFTGQVAELTLRPLTPRQVAHGPNER